VLPRLYLIFIVSLACVSSKIVGKSAVDIHYLVSTDFLCACEMGDLT
jgi:hypothetical protein